MVVSILLIYALAKRLGLKIYYSTFAAAAIVSFMTVFAAFVLSPALDRKFLLYLGGLILATSLLLTALNNFLIKKQRDEEKIFTEQVKAAYAEEIKKDSAKPLVEEIVKPIDKFEWNDDKPAPEEKIDEEPAKEIPEPVEESKPAEDFPLESVFKPLDDVKAEAVAKAMQDKDAAPFEEPKPEEISELIDLSKIKPVKEISEPVEVAKVEPVEEISEPVEVPKVEPVEEISEPVEVSKLETLDNILDRAYDARANGYIWQASALYKKALERYSDDEYAPFVAIDLGNLYKENALYSKAVKVYEDALTLPAVSRNTEIKTQFAKNLEYLRAVRDILLKHQAASTPFAKIPKEILQEIDAEFQKTQLRAV